MNDKITVMIAVNGKPHQVTKEQFKRWLLYGEEDKFLKENSEVKK